MKLASNLQSLLMQVDRWKEEDIYPYLPVVAGPAAQGALLEDGRTVGMFASCDYLGLSQDEYVKQRSIEAIQKFGTNTFGAQIFSGYTTVHRDLERRLAAFIGKEEAILFPSGMHANIGTISTLMGPNDVVINDRFNHSSIFMGCKLSGAQVRNYPHNDMERLERMLQESASAEKRLVVVDGLFSADGDYAPLDKICDLAERHDALVMVDEAHSVGVCGPNGRGAAEVFGVADRVQIIMGTMSKAFGSVGGFVAASHAIVNVVRHAAGAYQASRGSPPAVAAASLASLQRVVETGAHLRDKLWANTAYICEGLKRRGVDIMDTVSPIVPVLVGSGERTVAVTRWLNKQGLLVTAMIPPGVPLGKGRLRLGITARHTKEELDQAVELITEAKRIYAF